jgi:hypothetical protein
MIRDARIPLIVIKAQQDRASRMAARAWLAALQ